MLPLSSSPSQSACRRNPSVPAFCHNVPSAPATRCLLLAQVAPGHWCSTSRRLWPAAESLSKTKRASGTCAHSAMLDVSWMANIDHLAVAQQLNMVSLLPYLAFLFFLTTSHKAPKLTLAGFWAVLVFVAVTIPAGLYAKSHYGVLLSNVDWLHGSTESLLTCCNLLIVLGLRRAIRQQQEQDAVRAPDRDTVTGPSGACESALGEAAMGGSGQTTKNPSGAMEGHRVHT